MRKYFDYAILWDLLIAIITGALVFVFINYIENPLAVPSEQNLVDFGVSMITVSATLLGFLLTIITVIVTFKKGFIDKKSNNSDANANSDVPGRTVFNSKPEKEETFYSTPIHKSVVNVFLHATYEIGIVLLILLLIQLRILNMTLDWNFILNICTLILLILSIARSLYIFRLFLNVHV